MTAIVRSLVAVAAMLICSAAPAQDRPLIDSHIHYSHDAWEHLPPADALAVLRSAGLARAFVSSSSDEGTQMLYALAPDFIVPVLRPYRKRGELATWMHDETVVDMLQTKLAARPYAGIGEFHAFGSDADLPVLRRVAALAGHYGIFLHAHADADAVERIFAQAPDISVLWAHSGFTGPGKVRQMLEKYPNLQADLAFRGEFAQGGTLNPVWRQLFLDFPDRFMTGTDTYTPERWYAVADTAEFSRTWLAQLPDPVAAMIGHDNAAALADRALANWWAASPASGGEKCNMTDHDPPRIGIARGDDHQATLSTGREISVGRLFSVFFTVCRLDGSPYEGTVELTATMPDHGHGMNNAAVVSATGGHGRFRADGLMFHMPGTWRIHLQLSGQASDSDELDIDISVR